jgi:hypothetical protein
VVSNFTCESHADFCADLKCGFTRVDQDNIKISYGCDLKVVLNHIEVCSNFSQVGRHNLFKNSEISTPAGYD